MLKRVQHDEGVFTLPKGIIAALEDRLSHHAKIHQSAEPFAVQIVGSSMGRK